MGYKTESNKWTNKKNKQTKTHRHGQQHGGDQREGNGGIVKGKGVQIYCDGRNYDIW